MSSHKPSAMKQTAMQPYLEERSSLLMGQLGGKSRKSIARFTLARKAANVDVEIMTVGIHHPLFE
ncbi:hypothetical protein [Bradyrhizobium embrapense]